jgi:hypothetical protein
LLIDPYDINSGGRRDDLTDQFDLVEGTGRQSESKPQHPREVISRSDCVSM